MTRAKAVYNALLHAYPAPFRHEYGRQMCLMFADELRDARGAGRRGAELAWWARAAGDLLTVAPREHWHIIRQDLRYALRGMRRAPAFTAVAILSLALGIGANTAIYSMWNGLQRAALPIVRDADRLVILTNPNDSGSWTGGWGRADGPRSWLTYEEYEQLRERTSSFDGLMASQSSLVTWQIRFAGGGWEPATGRLVSDSFFDVLGVRPAIGRLFAGRAEAADSTAVVISHSYWQRRFGGRPDVLGTTFNLRSASFAIAGVAPPGFIGETAGQRPDLWLPLKQQRAVMPDRDRLHDTPPEKSMWLHVFGRLKPSVTVAQANGQAHAIFRAGLDAFYGASASEARRSELVDQRLDAQPGARGASAIRADMSTSLTALLVFVGVLLLIACVNVANLTLARGAARRQELAIRVSLGASRARLVRQLVTESLLLSVLGGLAS